MHRFKTIAIPALKFSLPVLIVGWLLSSISAADWQELNSRPKQWDRLVFAFLLTFAGIVITYFRWYMLVRTLGLPFRIRDALRLGFLGYMLNFVSLGSVGGDLFKAIFIAREQTSRRAEAVASVIVDRVIGLYALLVLASSATLAGTLPGQSDLLKHVGQITLLMTVTGALMVFLFAIAPVEKLSATLSWLPLRLGTISVRLVEALSIYRRRPKAVAVALAVSVVTHGMFVTALHLIASGILEASPTLAEHFVIGPVAFVAGAVPFMPAGLGALELALDMMYTKISSADLTAGLGVVVALGFRLNTISVATVGAIIYWFSKREVDELLSQGEEVAE
ncbi:MAG: lysylphosphatidylglycerol synthase transmembrane domain-containing protein [Planctomycetota bacterium]|nr:lysylphosphatidylglycerol synthase transmembrane domain-containing protein [Planctomycetota bacterium]